MTTKEAISVLSTFNKWRRGDDRDLEIPVKDIGIAIDAGIKALEIAHAMDSFHRAYQGREGKTVPVKPKKTG